MTVIYVARRMLDLEPFGKVSIGAFSDLGAMNCAMFKCLLYKEQHERSLSIGALILTYDYRLLGYSQRVGISYDEGQHWQWGWIIRDDAPDWDLGYPSTVELRERNGT